MRALGRSASICFLIGSLHLLYIPVSWQHLIGLIPSMTWLGNFCPTLCNGGLLPCLPTLLTLRLTGSGSPGVTQVYKSVRFVLDGLERYFTAFLQHSNSNHLDEMSSHTLERASNVISGGNHDDNCIHTHPCACAHNMRRNCSAICRCARDS